VELWFDHMAGKEVTVKRIPHVYLDLPSTGKKDPWTELAVAPRIGQVEGGGLECACACVGAFGNADGDAFLVLEYMAQGDLFSFASHLPAPGAQREAVIWPVALSLLRSVISLHEGGIAHGDICLENALLGDGGKVVLTDFASAFEGDCLVRSSNRGGRPVCGKRSYQAPEVHTDESFDGGLADLFSVGVCVYCLAIGEYPWQSTSSGNCAAYAYFHKHGFSSFAKKRKLMGAKVCISSVLSPALLQFLELLLNTDLSARAGAVEVLNSGKGLLGSVAEGLTRVEGK
jgi:serine/threonine protein kinase